MSRPDWTLDVLKRIFPRNPAQGRITRVPGVGRAIERLIFEGDHLLCLPRDKTVKVGRPIEDRGQMVLPSKLVSHFIDETDVHVLMDFCICRRSMECADYPVGLGCLFMGEAALGINPRWGRRVSGKEAKKHIRDCQKAGLIHFMGKSKLDTVWLGVGPGERLLTICNCCPCCCITRIVPYGAPRIGEKIHRAPGVEVRVSERCTGCATCTNGVCFVNAIRMGEGRAAIGAQCRGCGRCVEACPQKAIEISVDAARFLKESVEGISRVVNVG